MAFQGVPHVWTNKIYNSRIACSMTLVSQTHSTFPKPLQLPSRPLDQLEYSTS